MADLLPAAPPPGATERTLTAEDDDGQISPRAPIGLGSRQSTMDIDRSVEEAQQAIRASSATIHVGSAGSADEVRTTSTSF